MTLDACKAVFLGECALTERERGRERESAIGYKPDHLTVSSELFTWHLFRLFLFIRLMVMKIHNY